MRTTIITLLSCTLLLFSCTSIDSTKEPQTLTEVYLGMERDTTDWHYMMRDTLLESFPSMTKQECYATWYKSDSTKFKMSIGMYIDKEFPSEAVQARMEEAIDTTLINCLDYYFYRVDKDSLLTALQHNRPKNTEEILEFAKKLFDDLTRLFSRDYREDEYYKVFEGRVCVVSHMIYENDKYATYLIENTIDYNGSCGFTCTADYYTIDKHSGNILSKEEILNDMTRDTILNMIQTELEPYKDGLIFNDANKDIYIDEMSGAALVNEGILVYYHPYTISSGATGEPIFILKTN